MKRCNLCGFLVVKINQGIFGTRCLFCTSTFIHRAVGIALETLILDESIRVYELSSRGALFRYLKKRFKYLTFSEYYDDVTPGQFLNGVQCQDVEKLTYKNGSFDLVTSTEVFEHVPNDLNGFKEIYRVLRENGKFVFTVPLSGQDRTVERALIRDGKIIHHLPAEYHGDRIRGQGRVLAFRNYGLDIKDRLKSIGFGVEILAINDSTRAIANAKVILCTKGSS